MSNVARNISFRISEHLSLYWNLTVTFGALVSRVSSRPRNSRAVLIDRHITAVGGTYTPKDKRQGGMELARTLDRDQCELGDRQCGVGKPAGHHRD
jgi:hypothetical protein